MNFFEILLIIIASFYVLGWIGRLMLRRYLKRVQKKMQERMNEFQQGHYQQQQQQRPEGEINIDFGKNQKKSKRSGGSDSGEYVDFEEID